MSDVLGLAVEDHRQGWRLRPYHQLGKCWAMRNGSGHGRSEHAFGCPPASATQRPCPSEQARTGHVYRRPRPRCPVLHRCRTHRPLHHSRVRDGDGAWRYREDAGGHALRGISSPGGSGFVNDIRGLIDNRGQPAVTPGALRYAAVLPDQTARQPALKAEGRQFDPGPDHHIVTSLACGDASYRLLRSAVG